MSAYSTKTITPLEAVKMISKCRAKANEHELLHLPIQELEKELNSYAYDQDYFDCIEALIDYRIVGSKPNQE